VPRKLREEVAGGIFHVYARGNEKRKIFVDDFDRQVYLNLFGRVAERQRWSCLAYCLMPNHVHWLVRTPEPNLGEGVRLVHGPFAQGFNVRHQRVGHLFQGRYGAVAVTDDAQLWTTVGYIAANPVTAGLAEDAAEWAWSSHRAMSGVEGAPPPWLDVGALVELLAAQGGDGRERYRELVADRVPSAGVTVSASEVITGDGSGSVVR
jgi:REP element-mobilizing transposase RayT